MSSHLPRVLHVAKALGRGGAERLILEIARRARAVGHDHQVAVVLAKPDAMAVDFAEANIPVHHMNANGTAGLYRLPGWLRGLVHQGSFDVVHGHFPLTSSLSRLARPRARFRYVFTHHLFPSRYRRATRLLHQLTWSLVDLGVCVSDAVRADAARVLGRRRPLLTIDNGIDTHWYVRRRDQAAARTALGLDPHVPVVGLVANLAAQKRIDRWISVAAEVYARHPLVRFLIVGDGPDAKAARELVSQCGIGHVVEFAGRVRDPRPYFEAMDLFLLTSDHEGFGLVVAEAMAMEVVPVVSAVGPLPDIVRPEWGRAVAPEASELARVVIELLSDAPQRRALAAMVRPAALKWYDIDRMVRAYLELYQKLVDDAASPGVRLGGRLRTR